MRPAAGSDVDPTGWGRFDVYDGATVYLAQPKRCAYVELLAWMRRGLGQADALAKDAEFLGLGPTELADVVEREWGDRGHMRPGHVPAGWRQERRLYEIRTPETGWWIDIEHVDSISTISSSLGEELAALGLKSLDRSILLGPDRAVTVAIATWARGLLLEDGTSPLGMVWQSRHGSGRCWAAWGSSSGREPAQRPALRVAPAGRPIARTDKALREAAERLGLTVW